LKNWLQILLLEEDVSFELVSENHLFEIIFQNNSYRHHLTTKLSHSSLATVPSNVKAELLQRIRKFLATVTQNQAQQNTK